MKKTAWMLGWMVMTSTAAHAADNWFAGRLSIGGGYGITRPLLPETYHDQYEQARIWTVQGKYFVNEYFSFVISYADLFSDSKTTTDRIQFRPIVGGVRLNIFENVPVTPYITAGAGISRNRRHVASGTGSEWQKATFQGGGGLEFFINQGTSLGAEALYHHFEADAPNHPYRLLSFTGKVNIYFGEGPAMAKARAELEQKQRDAEEAKRAAQEAQKRAEDALAKAGSAQQAADAAEKAAMEAKAAQAGSEQKAQQLEAQMQRAQQEVEKIKEMVAKKAISPINFASGKSTILPISYPTLDLVLKTVQKYPSLKLRVEGHTDSVGSDAINQRLSQLRADAVRDYLAAKGALAPDRVVSVGFGEAQPIDTNATTQGRANNRRVEFIFFIE